LLERALIAGAAARGVDLAIGEAQSTRWASVTFSGARHRLACGAAAGDALERWIADLPEAEFRLRGHLVAQIAVTARRESGAGIALTVEALTVEDE
jgi:hypothetical protein